MCVCVSKLCVHLFAVGVIVSLTGVLSWPTTMAAMGDCLVYG